MTIFWIFSAKTTNSIYNKVYMVREAVLYCPGFVGSFESITWSISVFDTRIKSNWLKNENQYDSYWGTFWNYWGLQIRLGPVTGPRLNFNKQGCAFSMVLWPDFLMWQYRVNDHPYHAPQFIFLPEWFDVSVDVGEIGSSDSNFGSISGLSRSKY